MHCVRTLTVQGFVIMVYALEDYTHQHAVNADRWRWGAKHGMGIGFAETAASMLSILSSAPLAFAGSEPTFPRQGFVGVYNAAVGTVADGHNTSAFDIGSWGITALENSVSQDGVAFSDSIALLCDQKDVNQLFGMLIAGSEGGTFSNPNDTALLAPLPLCRSDMSECPRGRAGMLQGAARFSELARTRCPQITGVIIDDFWCAPALGVPNHAPMDAHACPSLA